MPAAERRQRISAALVSLGLRNRAQLYPAQLCGGQQQRVAIVRAMIARPALILADEPTGNLDSKNSRDMLTLLRQFIFMGPPLLL
nr:ATP-binding cassette domain-containing protein [Candidatus Sodalis endolongispinus]